MRRIARVLARALVWGAGLLLLLNLVAALLSLRGDGGPVARYGIERLTRAQPGRTRAQVERLMRESFGPHLRLRYHPFAAFRNPEVSGEFIRVAAAGFRWNATAHPWPPPSHGLNLFLFGGSTAFGLGVADHETIATHLEERLRGAANETPVRVYNFGVPAYFSSQELALFIDLLREGARVDVAVFFDGLNEFHYPDGRPEFYYLLQHAMASEGTLRALRGLPLVHALEPLVRRGAWNSPRVTNPDSAIAEVVRRWANNRLAIEAVARPFGVTTLFVWQPVPTYRYDLRAHAFADNGRQSFDRHELSAAGYGVVEQLQDTTPFRGVLWLGDIQESRQENLYVDRMHYTARFSSEIAGRIADEIAARGLLIGAHEPARR